MYELQAKPIAKTLLSMAKNTSTYNRYNTMAYSKS